MVSEEPSEKVCPEPSDQGGLTSRLSLCSNRDLKGAREWLIDAIARRALEILKEQKQ